MPLPFTDPDTEAARLPTLPFAALRHHLNGVDRNVLSPPSFFLTTEKTKFYFVTESQGRLCPLPSPRPEPRKMHDSRVFLPV
jgi:hypothetical protein